MSITNLIHNFYEENKKESAWENSPFKEIKLLENDKTGELGEKIASNVFNSLKYNIQEDTSTKTIRADGHYDLKVENKRVEIKTSCYSHSFQHEPLYREDLCDIVIFIDFYYDKFFITIVKNSDLPLGRKSIIFGAKKGTLRKNKDDGYKLDFSLKLLQKLKENKVSESFKASNSIKDISLFIDGWWKRNV